MRETNAVQMLYVSIFMDHTVALVKKAIMEMAKTAKVRFPKFSSFPLVLFAESTLRLQSNLDYPDLDYPDFSIIRTFSLVPFFL